MERNLGPTTPRADDTINPRNHSKRIELACGRERTLNFWARTRGRDDLKQSTSGRVAAHQRARLRVRARAMLAATLNTCSTANSTRMAAAATCRYSGSGRETQL